MSVLCMDLTAKLVVEDRSIAHILSTYAFIEYGWVDKLRRRRKDGLLEVSVGTDACDTSLADIIDSPWVRVGVVSCKGKERDRYQTNEWGPVEYLDLLTRQASGKKLKRMIQETPHLYLLHPEIPVVTLEKAASGPNRVAVACNVKTPAYLLDQLAMDTDDNVRRGVASNPSTPANTLAELSRNNSSGYIVAGNPVAPAELLEAIINSTDDGRRVAAANPKLPHYLIKRLRGVYKTTVNVQRTLALRSTLDVDEQAPAAISLGASSTHRCNHPLRDGRKCANRVAAGSKLCSAGHRPAKQV